MALRMMWSHFSGVGMWGSWKSAPRFRPPASGTSELRGTTCRPPASGDSAGGLCRPPASGDAAASAGIQGS
eukprot:198529-Alexandrium_andersonii.AAC.1